ncbi:MAG: NACHT domain-containing protein, partial [Moorea sp. SIO2B7]|nr:NACHT domain-containing protein [Moorena sp. SIO2B7]
ALYERLNLRNAICIQPLSSEYISWYLDDVGKPLQGLKQLLQRDKELEKFARTPLIFSVMTVAYQDYSLETLLKEMSVKEKRYEKLFDNYIKRMFQRKIETQKYWQYSKLQTKKWLIWLAQQMKRNSIEVFLIEKIQPSWLINKPPRLLSQKEAAVCMGLAAVFYFGIMSSGINGGVLMLGLIFGLIGWLISRLYDSLFEEVKIVETLHWSQQEAQKYCLSCLKNFFYLGFILECIILIYNIYSNEPHPFFIPLINALSVGLFLGIFWGIYGGFIGGNRELEIDHKNKKPNQGIFISSQKALIFGIITGLIGGIISYSSSFNIIIGLFFGITGSLFAGGSAVVKHGILRFILWKKHYIPWNYAHFFDYATERIFMYKVGGGYIFIHRMLMKHFANKKLD